MANITTSKEACDVCRNPRRQVKVYRVGQDGLLVKVLLCKEHSLPLDKMIELGTVVPNQSPQVKVWSFEEIQRRKRETKKTPPTREG